MKNDRSQLDRLRAEYRPALPDILDSRLAQATFGEVSMPETDDVVRRAFPGTHASPRLELKLGGKPPNRAVRAAVVLSGGQAPGGHNVITGLYDGLRTLHRGSRLFGFLGGPRGIFDDRQRELTAEQLADYRNTGGFDLIGSGRDKISTGEQLSASLAACAGLELDGLVIVGGDDSNTNAAILAEYFVQNGSPTSVIGVPKTIDGDLKGHGVEISFGFDTATKVYSELIGNICRDAKSAGKYWHFVKLMGRSASHVALECALQTRTNLTLIGEEIERDGLTLRQVIERIVNVIRKRADAGLNYGVCLIPEGLIEFIPEMQVLIRELNSTLAAHREFVETLRSPEETADFVSQNVPHEVAELFDAFPPRIRQQLVLDRDSHGNVQVSKIDTEQLIISLAATRIAEIDDFRGTFSVQGHFLGYEGRCASPSNFDANYTYALGRLAAVLAARGRTGYIGTLGNLAAPPDRWRAGAVPLVSMIGIETRKGAPTPVIRKALVDTEGEPFSTFASARESWQLEDRYVYPGAMQYFGPPEIADRITRTLELEYPPGQ